MLIVTTVYNALVTHPTHRDAVRVAAARSRFSDAAVLAGSDEGAVSCRSLTHKGRSHGDIVRGDVFRDGAVKGNDKVADAQDGEDSGRGEHVVLALRMYFMHPS